MPRPRLALAAASIGFASANVLRIPVVAVLVGVLVSVLTRRFAAVLAVIVLAGWWWGSVRLAALDHSVLASRVGTAESALVEVSAPPRPAQFRLRVRARVVRFGSLRPHENVLLELPLGGVPPQGARLSLVGVLRAPRGPEHGFDERTWLEHLGIHVVMRAQSWRLVGHRRGLGAVADRLHDWLSRDSAFGLSGERRGVLAGIVLGETQGLDDGLLARFRASGLYHVLAVDGLKVTAVAAGAGAFAFLLGAGRFVAELAALVAVAGYVLAVGTHPSAIRAAIAAALVSLAWLTARQRDRWHALLVAAAVLLAWNPYVITDAGFQLSFAAVAGIFTIAPRVARMLEGYPVPQALAQLVAVSTACGLATAPITWLQFHQVSLVTVPANVVGVPIVAEMLGLGLLTAVLAPIAPPVAAALAQLNGWGAVSLAGWARLTGGVPFAQISSPRAVAFATACFVFALSRVVGRDSFLLR